MSDNMKSGSARRRLLRLMAWMCVAGTVFSNVAVPASHAQASVRKVKLSTPPEYPELAKKMKIQGVARVLLTVAADGKVMGVKELGGHPVLLSALMDAVKKWKYEAADRESSIEVRFEFK